MGGLDSDAGVEGETKNHLIIAPLSNRWYRKHYMKARAELRGFFILSADSPDAFSTFHHLKRFREGRQKIAEFIEGICRKENIYSQDLWMGSRIKRICQIGAQIVYQLVENFGILLAEVGRQV